MMNIMELRSNHIVMAAAASSASHWVKLGCPSDLRLSPLRAFMGSFSTMVVWARRQRPKTKRFSAPARLSQRPFVDLQKDEEIMDGALNY